MAGSGAGYSLDTESHVTTGPVQFGATTSGTGTVIFGTSSPGLTAAAANISSSPWLMLGAGAVLLVGLYIYVHYRK